MASMYAFGCQRERLQGPVAHELQRLRNGDVKVIYYRQSVSNLLRAYGMASARSPSDTQPRFATDKWGRISVLILSLFCTSKMIRELILVLQLKD